MTYRSEDPFGSLLPDVSSRPPGTHSRLLAERLSLVESRNVTYWGDDWPLFWDEARGANVRDVDGNVYVDLTGAFGVALLGHAHPAVVSAVQDQSRQLLHGMGDVHPPRIKLHLLERLQELAPWDDAKTVLASTGSEAVEIALKTAQVATGRPGALAFQGGYHGLTLGSLSATERAHFRGPFSRRLYGGVAFAPFPDVLRDGDDTGEACLERVQELLASGAPNGDEIGAIVVEPVQGRAGARVAPHGFMSSLSRLASEVGVLVVADEILTGMGRCGAMFASERVGLRPDILCLGKALGGGVPVSACVAPAEIMDAWPKSEGEAIHTSTFLGHPLGCAAALAVLDTYEEEAVVERSRLLGEQLLTSLRGRLEGVPAVGDVRGLGLLLGVELVTDDGQSPNAEAAVRVAAAALAEGVLVLPAGAEGHVIELTPPVQLSDEQASYAIDGLARAIEAAT